MIMGVVVGLTFLFGFGNVLNLALRLGVPAWVAPLVAPAVDLSILGLLLGTRHLALTGASPEVLRPARRLLIFASVVTLALNVAEPLVAGEFGKAAFDAVGPLLLIGWSEVGPGLLQAIGATSRTPVARDIEQPEPTVDTNSDDGVPEAQVQLDDDVPQQGGEQAVVKRTPEALLAQARREDAAHRATHQKPISADTLRVRLGIGATRARRLVKAIREEYQVQRDQIEVDATSEEQRASASLAA
ncbi:hypothetical protein BJ998_003063 [Kutzneria kofuensis]|uniref:DUF2637 domain-containing protein n=1 Tax=Kutzneria kofuensis TaxID=103725 RepID=A0A7W9KG82_9PSEU|nr:hypothetical protein [Kutzneria kofuensis]